MQAFPNTQHQQVTNVTEVGRALSHGSTEYSWTPSTRRPESRLEATDGVPRGP
jgi:hypothetical protein